MVPTLRVDADVSMPSIQTLELERGERRQEIRHDYSHLEPETCPWTIDTSYYLPISYIDKSEKRLFGRRHVPEESEITICRQCCDNATLRHPAVVRIASQTRRPARQAGMPGIVYR